MRRGAISLFPIFFSYWRRFLLLVDLSGVQRGRAVPPPSPGGGTEYKSQPVPALSAPCRAARLFFPQSFCSSFVPCVLPAPFLKEDRKVVPSLSYFFAVGISRFPVLPIEKSCEYPPPCPPRKLFAVLFFSLPDSVDG